ncbi:hypothetical protein PI124_g18875 [Phytophthora idaei]|nr:hypothetical protein PI125_g19781 [Phytophthora idaei]KAG3135517.1 hypothetical protein PI126_g18222 [Phytophthora idaei]KAG3236110.1 hypothetical protein PI124_g18875 [Phytophthora idaei]
MRVDDLGFDGMLVTGYAMVAPATDCHRSARKETEGESTTRR